MFENNSIKKSSAKRQIMHQINFSWLDIYFLELFNSNKAAMFLLGDP